MNKKKMILIIGSILIFFVVLNVVARGFCEPNKEGSFASMIEKNIPKPAGLDVSEMRTSWILLFSKFCGNSAAPI